MSVRRVLVIVAAAVATAVLAAAAQASQIVTTSGVTGIKLGVNAKGEAMVTYTSRGKVVHVLAWGAVNAVAPSRGGSQVELQLAYDGGYAKEYTDSPALKAAHTPAARASLRLAAQNYYTTFTCPAYTGPKLAFELDACTAPDGSYWALQGWPRGESDYGGSSAPLELHIAHWTGDLPVLSAGIGHDLQQHSVVRLWGTFSYAGSPVFGYKATPAGRPLDSFGRNVYIDTYDSAYGSGWRRENSVLVHTSTGAFCYTLVRHGSHPAGTGSSYRLTAVGPGVTPDVSITLTAPAPYSAAQAAQTAAAIRALDDSQCSP